MRLMTGKLYVLTLYVIMLGALTVVGKVDGSACIAAVGPFVGYVIGNGVTTLKGDVPPPVILPKAQAD